MQILERLLAKDPGDRFAGAAETARALKTCRERLLSGVEQVDESKRPKLDPENPMVPTWATTSVRAGSRLGSLLPLLGVAAMLALLVGAWFVGERLSEVRESPPPPARRSVAVEPFASLGDGAGQDSLVNALQKEIVASLARERALRIVADDLPGSAKAGAVLVGSVRRAGDRVRVAVQLVDSASGRNLWAENFDRDAADLRELPGLIARAVAQALDSETGPP